MRLRVRSLELMSLRERKWMGLSGFENEFCVTFLKNLGVIVSGLGSKVCE